MGEPLVQCDVTLLVNVPAKPSAMPVISGGKSAAQDKYGRDMRQAKLQEWRPDLPENIYNGLLSITDPTWWIANKDADASEIKWPESWTELRNRQSTARPAPPQGKTLCQVFEEEERAKAVNGCSPKLIRDIQQFESFARKAAMSPELSYLTILALVYRQVKDPRVLALFRESRERIEGHLAAINQIIGE